MEPEPPGAAFFAWSRSQFGRSRSQCLIRNLRLPEPEPPKKVAAPQHWVPSPTANPLYYCKYM